MWWTACHIGLLNKLRFLRLLIFPCVLVTLLLTLTINSVVSSSLTCHPLLILAHTHSYSRFWVTHHCSASVGSQRCGHGSWWQASRGEIFSLFLVTFFRTFWHALTLLGGENENADRFRALRPRRTTTMATDAAIGVMRYELQCRPRFQLSPQARTLNVCLLRLLGFGNCCRSVELHWLSSFDVSS